MPDGQATAVELSQPSVLRWAMTAWRDGFAAFRQMPGALGVAALAVLALNLVIGPLLREREGFGAEIFGIVDAIIEGFVLTPAAIAVHRFVLLSERATRYRLAPFDPRFRKFFFFVAVIELVAGIPLALAKSVSGWAGTASEVAYWAFALAGLVLVLRMLLLFPAIAVDAPGAAWRKAYQDTKTHAWHMLFIAIVTGIPLIVLYLVIVFGTEALVGPSNAGEAIAETVRSVLTAAIFAALASRMFTAFADRLRAPAGRPATTTV
jgi:hypothetical protein